VTFHRVYELLVGVWSWLPVRGKVAFVLLALALLVGLVSTLVAYVWVPFVFYRRNVIHTVDRTRTIEPAFREPIDAKVLEFVSHAEQALVTLGFSAPHRITTSQDVPLTAVGSLLEHPSEGDLASVTAIRSTTVRAAEDRQSASPRLARVSEAYSVSFTSRFADGIEIVTTNSTAPRYWPDQPQMRITRVGDVSDVAQLYALHRSRAADHSKRSRRVPLTRGVTPDQRLVFAKRESLTFYNHLVRCGYHRRANGGLRPTVRGAILTVWRARMA